LLLAALLTGLVIASSLARAMFMLAGAKLH
jgi:hypothetical protein